MTSLKFVACLPLVLALAACAGKAPPAEHATTAPDACGDGQVVALTDLARTGSVFAHLLTTQSATLKFACPGDQSCELPRDQQLTLEFTSSRSSACEFAACDVPYLAALPIGQPGENEPCPRVLWSTFALKLKSDKGTLDFSASDVNVLASAHGDGSLRFMIESTRSPASSLGALDRSVLLDVQLEVEGTRVRGQLSALAASNVSEPGSELRFGALWSATWESTAPGE